MQPVETIRESDVPHLPTRIALADVPRLSMHSLRHLCFDESGPDGLGLHAITTFAGHRSTDSTLRYIHLSVGIWRTSSTAEWRRSMRGGMTCSPRPVP